MKTTTDPLSLIEVTKLDPAYFGLGFIQCKLNENQRIHFYHPELKPIVDIEEEVHTHRYDFLSVVLAGQITNKIYRFEVKEENHTHILSDVSCNPDRIDDLIHVPGVLKLFESKEIEKGNSYVMDRREFHTFSTSFCITSLYRGPVLKEFAQVVRPVNAMATCPFSVSLSKSRCLELIDDCLRLAREETLE